MVWGTSSLCVSRVSLSPFYPTHSPPLRELCLATIARFVTRSALCRQKWNTQSTPQLRYPPRIWNQGGVWVGLTQRFSRRHGPRHARPHVGPIRPSINAPKLPIFASRSGLRPTGKAVWMSYWQSCARCWTRQSQLCASTKTIQQQESAHWVPLFGFQIGFAGFETKAIKQRTFVCINKCFL